MYDLKPMAVVDAGDHLLEEPSSLLFRHASSVDNIFEQFTAGELENYYNVCRRRDNLVTVNKGSAKSLEDNGDCDLQLDDVGMAKMPHILDLSLHTCLRLGSIDHVLRQELHRNFLTGYCMDGHYRRLV